MAQHLANEELVAEYACGSSSPGMSLLVSAHLTGTVERRQDVSLVEQVGGALLCTEQSEEMSADALDRALSALNESVGEQPLASHSASPLPNAVVDAVGMPYDQIPWKFVMPGVTGYDLDGFEGEHVSLLKAKPGVKLPQHTHDGVEVTLVLQGALSDGGIVYQKGDVAMNDEADDHRPEIVGNETCICLIVRQGDLRFTGRFSRILNYLGE